MEKNTEKNPGERNINNILNTSNSITESFSKLKFVTISCLVGAFLCAIGCVVYTSYSISQIGEKVYVIDNGQTMSASRQDPMLTKAAVIREQSKLLHRLLFTVSPNREVVSHNLEEALQISDKSVYNYYKDIDEKGFYRRVSQTGAVQDIVVDSVKTDIRKYPYPVITYATIIYVRETSMQKNSLISRCYMLDIPKNDKNIAGLQIERFEVLENKKIDERRR